MSIDLSIVTLDHPDLKAAQRLAICALGLLAQDVDVAGVLTYVPDEGRHEFDGEFVVDLMAQSRETESYLAMLVLGSALSVLYNGRLADEVGFFPQQSASEVLQRCLGQSNSTALDLWQSLQGASP